MSESEDEVDAPGPRKADDPNRAIVSLQRKNASEPIGDGASAPWADSWPEMGSRRTAQARFLDQRIQRWNHDQRQRR